MREALEEAGVRGILKVIVLFSLVLLYPLGFSKTFSTYDLSSSLLDG